MRRSYRLPLELGEQARVSPRELIDSIEVVVRRVALVSAGGEHVFDAVQLVLASGAETPILSSHVLHIYLNARELFVY